jgi:hypothetical protein
MQGCMSEYGILCRQCQINFCHGYLDIFMKRITKMNIAYINNNNEEPK